MRKLALIILACMGLILTGCQQRQTTKTKADSVKTTTLKTLKPASKTWIFSQSVSSKQTPKQGVSNQLTPSVISKTDSLNSWTTAKGQFMSSSVKYQQLSFAKWQQAQRQHFVKSAQSRIHYMSVSQVNAVLKQLGATFKIQKLSDLVYLETQTSSLPLDQAFVAQGHHLYGINIQYIDNEQAITIKRGTVFTDTDTKQAGKHLDVASLNGTWIAAETTTSASDTGKIMVKDGYLYQHRYDSYERSAVQDLSHYSLTSLNQNTTYAAHKTDAAHAGYQLTQQSVASGDTTGYLYLFISKNQLIRIGQGQTTTYQKTSATIGAADLPQSDLTIFTQVDQQKPASKAATITSKTDAPVVGLSDSLNYLTDPNAGQITSNVGVSLNQGKLTLKN